MIGFPERGGCMVFLRKSFLELRDLEQALQDACMLDI